jgi:hypothetical protein
MRFTEAASRFGGFYAAALAWQMDGDRFPPIPPIMSGKTLATGDIPRPTFNRSRVTKETLCSCLGLCGFELLTDEPSDGNTRAAGGLVKPLTKLMIRIVSV